MASATACASGRSLVMSASPPKLSPSAVASATVTLAAYSAVPKTLSTTTKSAPTRCATAAAQSIE